MSNLFAQIEKAEVEFLITNAVVEQYPYRQKSLGAGMFLAMKRSDLADFEQQLATASGEHMANHTVYSIAQDGCTTIYVMFHDLEVSFGLTIR